MGNAPVLGQTMSTPTMSWHTTRKLLALAVVACSFASALVTAAEKNAPATLIVSGLGGSAEYDELFVRHSEAIATQARQLGSDEADIILLQGEQSGKDAILDALSQLRQRENDIASIRIFLLGHGSFDGSEYKFNIPGPDLTGSELIAALNELSDTTPQLIVLSTSASGAVLEPLQADHRVVITATKNGRERNAVKFTEHLVTGMADSGADTDKDETISALELYEYAERAVASHYENEKLLASEHSRLSGAGAERFELARYGTLLANQAEISEDLLAERRAISARIGDLRERKDDLTEDEYFDQLQTLMLELATVQRAIDEPADSKDDNPPPLETSNNAVPANSTAEEVTPSVD
jgi:hypothetical protein